LNPKVTKQCKKFKKLNLESCGSNEKQGQMSCLTDVFLWPPDVNFYQHLKAGIILFFSLLLYAELKMLLATYKLLGISLVKVDLFQEFG